MVEADNLEGIQSKIYSVEHNLDYNHLVEVDLDQMNHIEMASVCPCHD